MENDLKKHKEYFKKLEDCIEFNNFNYKQRIQILSTLNNYINNYSIDDCIINTKFYITECNIYYKYLNVYKNMLYNI